MDGENNGKPYFLMDDLGFFLLFLDIPIYSPTTMVVSLMVMTTMGSNPQRKSPVDVIEKHIPFQPGTLDITPLKMNESNLKNDGLEDGVPFPGDSILKFQPLIFRGVWFSPYPFRWDLDLFLAG